MNWTATAEYKSYSTQESGSVPYMQPKQLDSLFLEIQRLSESHLGKPLTLEIEGTPMPKQSVRSFIRGGKIAHYQKTEVVKHFKNVEVSVKSQLPKDFTILDGNIIISVDFIFEPPSSWSKKKMKELEEGAYIPKTTRPDLTDNLKKGLCDALTGIVWTEDSRISTELLNRKYYGLKAKTIIKIWKM